jgi:hypothetical protein
VSIALKSLIRKKLTTHLWKIFGYLAFVTSSLLIVLRMYVIVLVICDQILMNDFSIAIWNKNRVVVGISLGVWMTNIAFLIQGESGSLSLNLSVYQESYTKRLDLGIARVNDKTILYPVVD